LYCQSYYQHEKNHPLELLIVYEKNDLPLVAECISKNAASVLPRK
jgi:hypothetical protein